MRVGIYLVPLLDRVTGRERGMRGLLDALARLDEATDYYLFVRPGNRRLFRRPEPNFHTVVVRLPSLPSAGDGGSGPPLPWRPITATAIILLVGAGSWVLYYGLREATPDD